MFVLLLRVQVLCLTHQIMWIYIKQFTKSSYALITSFVRKQWSVATKSFRNELTWLIMTS